MSKSGKDKRNILDKAVEAISPRAGYQREVWRAQCTDMRSYDAGDYSRLNAGWRAINESAEMTDRVSRDTIRARARDLERNSDIANSLISAFKRNVIGGGFNLQARTGDEKLNSEIERLWKEWTKRENCDITQMQSFSQMLRLLVVRKKVDGGVLILKNYGGDGIIPLKLQLLEVDELATNVCTAKSKKNKVSGGIEYEPCGKIAGYWFQRYTIDGIDVEEPEYYSAANVIFYFSKKRTSQIREISDLTPVMTRIRDTNEFITAVSVKQRIAACLAVFIKKLSPSGSVGRGGGSPLSSSYEQKKLSPGMIKELNPGESIETVQPSGSGTDSAVFLKQQQHLIGAGQGLSYESTSRDMSEVNYSSARQGIIEDKQTYAEEIELLKENVMDEIYKAFITAVVLSGKIKENVGDCTDLLPHQWVAETKPWIDPVKEATANKIALLSGEKTFKQICAESGHDWKEQINDISEVSKYASEMGVTLINTAEGKKNA